MELPLTHEDQQELRAAYIRCQRGIAREDQQRLIADWLNLLLGEPPWVLSPEVARATETTPLDTIVRAGTQAFAEGRIKKRPGRRPGQFTRVYEGPWTPLILDATLKNLGVSNTLFARDMGVARTACQHWMKRGIPNHRQAQITELIELFEQASARFPEEDCDSLTAQWKSLHAKFRTTTKWEQPLVEILAKLNTLETSARIHDQRSRTKRLLVIREEIEELFKTEGIVLEEILMRMVKTPLAPALRHEG